MGERSPTDMYIVCLSRLVFAAEFLSSGKYSNKHGQSGLIKNPGTEFRPGML